MPCRVRARSGWITGRVGEERGRGGRSVLVAAVGEGGRMGSAAGVGANVVSESACLPACLPEA